MRKFLIMLMLAWLPVQVSWAAVSVYCQHEDEATQASRAHPGHHEHEHSDAAQALDDAPAGTGKPAAHPDCSVCHSSVAVMPAVHAGTQAAAPARITALLPLAHPAPLPFRPERPNWSPA